MGKTIREWETLFNTYTIDELNKVILTGDIIKSIPTIYKEYNWVGFTTLGVLAKQELKNRGC